MPAAAPSVRTDQQRRQRCRHPIDRAKKATASSDGRTLAYHEWLVAAVAIACRKRPRARGRAGRSDAIAAALAAGQAATAKGRG
ncbi:hypothetical protein GW17_00025747 [Ensete ventricosum]|nr:hypothetical protein GW17_00025747 [Ensete ventricosum]